MQSSACHADFYSFYATYAPLARRMLARRGIREEDLDDALQETFVIVHRLLAGFEGRSSVETWLYSITWRVAASFQRRARNRLEVATEQADQWAAGVPAVSNLDREVQATLGRMEAEQRDVIALHDIAEFSISEVSKLTGRARPTIRQRLDHARTALRRRTWTALTKADDEPWLGLLPPPLAGPLIQPDRPRVHDVVRDEVVIATLDDIVIALWRGDATDLGMQALIDVLFCALETHPEGIRHLCIVPMSRPPSRESRKLSSWAAGILGDRLRAAAWAAEGTMMSLVAPIMNACFFIGGTPLNTRFFGSAGPAAAWLAQYGARPPAEILAHVERMRFAALSRPNVVPSL